MRFPNNSEGWFAFIITRSAFTFTFALIESLSVSTTKEPAAKPERAKNVTVEE
jgi:hypothetical protein